MLTELTKTRLFSLLIFLLFAGDLITSLFFKENLLWMDEILSYLFISDSSLDHLNNAIVSGLDANPPLFANLYWLIAHAISLKVIFLKSVSIVLFAATIALFYGYTTRLVGTPLINFLLISGIAALTHLNITLAIQIRSYALFLLISFIYFIILHRLTRQPARVWLLTAHLVVGLLLALTHNFGLFYLAASGLFFGLLWLWSKDRRYGYVLASFGLIGVAWLLIWYPKFAIQAKAGIPHSWIPVPTWQAFFQIVGELAPTVWQLEILSTWPIVAILRFVLLVSLFSYIAVPRLKNGFSAVVTDPGFMLYLLAGFMYVTTILIALSVSFVHTSVFISRYLWPNHLLVSYQLVYAFYYFIHQRFPRQFARRTDRLAQFGWVVPVYLVVLVSFLYYQSQRLILAPTSVMTYVNQLNKDYPVFLESSVNFIPVWFYNNDRPINFLLDQKSAFDPRNDLGASVGFYTLASVKEKYKVKAIIPLAEFNKRRVSHFFVVDERWNYQIERFIQNGFVKVIQVIPTTMDGFRILECVVNDPAAGVVRSPAS